MIKGEGDRGLRRLAGLSVFLAFFLPGCESHPPERPIDPNAPAVQIRRIDASDALDEDQYGWSVGLDGDRIVVGTNIIDPTTYRPGKAFLCSRDRGGADNWGEVARLAAGDGEEFDLFGTAVALDGDTAVVGAYSEDGDALDQGAAYVFSADQGGSEAWGQVKKITSPDVAESLGFGYAVAIDGDTIVIGFPYDMQAAWAGGSAFIFSRDRGGSDSWGLVKKLLPGDPGTAAYFGWSVAIDGDRAVIGAVRDAGLGIRSGAVYIFERNAGGTDNWGEVVKLTPPEAADDDAFGSAVAVAGDLVLAGASWKHRAGIETGAAYLFGQDQGGSGEWSLIKELLADTPGAGDAFGLSVALSDDCALIGAPGDDGRIDDLGAAYVFRRDEGGAGAWGMAGKVTPVDANEISGFGQSVSLASDLFAVGAPGRRNGGIHRGAAYVYRLKS